MNNSNENRQRISTCNSNDREKILDKQAQVTVNLKNVTENIIEGEDPLGTVVNDSNSCDNLNQLLEDANRSFILRTLIRCSI